MSRPTMHPLLQVVEQAWLAEVETFVVLPTDMVLLSVDADGASISVTNMV